MRINLGENEKLHATRARVNQRSRIDVAFDQHPRKWRVHTLKGFHLLETTDIGIGRCQIRLACWYALDCVSASC